MARTFHALLAGALVVTVRGPRRQRGGSALNEGSCWCDVRGGRRVRNSWRVMGVLAPRIPCGMIGTILVHRALSACTRLDDTDHTVAPGPLVATRWLYFGMRPRRQRQPVCMQLFATFAGKSHGQNSHSTPAVPEDTKTPPPIVIDAPPPSKTKEPKGTAPKEPKTTKLPKECSIKTCCTEPGTEGGGAWTLHGTDVCTIADVPTFMVDKSPLVSSCFLEAVSVNAQFTGCPHAPRGPPPRPTLDAATRPCMVACGEVHQPIKTEVCAFLNLPFTCDFWARTFGSNARGTARVAAVAHGLRLIEAAHAPSAVGPSAKGVGGGVDRASDVPSRW